MRSLDSKRCYARLFVLFGLVNFAVGWGNSDGDNTDMSVYGNALDRSWLYDSSSISLKLEGCMWGYVEDNEDSGCLEDESEDGTYYWYQMANCRRAQAVFSLYATSSGTASCNGANFKETYVSRNGLSEFLYYLQAYDENNPFGDYYGDNGNYDDDAGGGDNFDELPMCEQGDNGYIGLGCASDGTFALQYFNDQYCLQPSGATYSKLRRLNQALKSYRSCATVYYSGAENNLAEMLSYNSDSCSSLDSGLCTDNSNMKSRRSNTGKKNSGRSPLGTHSWVTKLKYVAGGMLLLASLVMFTGILFTNRRRRRALMQRKYRQSRKDDRSRRSKRSKSKGPRDGSKSRRSKSKTRSRKSEGVFT